MLNRLWGSGHSAVGCLGQKAQRTLPGADSLRPADCKPFPVPGQPSPCRRCTLPFAKQLKVLRILVAEEGLEPPTRGL